MSDSHLTIPAPRCWAYQFQCVNSFRDGGYDSPRLHFTPWGIATVLPTFENTHLLARVPEAMDLPGFCMVRLVLTTESEIRDNPRIAPWCYAWTRPGLKGWAYGKRPPLAADAYMQKHPEIFAEYEVRELYPYAMAFSARGHVFTRTYLT